MERSDAEMISRTVEYALRAVVCLAGHAPASLSAGRVSAETGVPVSYLSKVLQSLVRGGLVAATRGARGGYAFAGKPASVTVLGVVNAIEPVERIESCPAGLKWHGGNGGRLCPLHRCIDSAAGEVERTFGSKTIADLLAEGGGVGMCAARDA
jgi:Rrf2 family protein